MNPKFIYAKSKSTDELTSSNASNYLEFMSVSQIYFFHKSKLLKVPFSKSEIFTSNDLELIEKQMLLAFLYAIMKIKNTDVDVNTTTDIKKDYELDSAILSNLQTHLNDGSAEFLDKHFSPKIQAMITLILGDIDPNANCDLITVDDLITKIYKFLLSVQIYDNTPYLYPQYGSSEFSQAFCRQSSVYGTIFLVNDLLKIKIVPNYENDLNKDKKKYLLNITDESLNETFTVFSDFLIINEAYVMDQMSSVILAPGIKINSMKENKKVMKYICIAVIKQITELRRDKDGPIYYKVKKNDEELCNCYGFTAIEYFNNTHSVPPHRSLLEIMILVRKEEDEAAFIGNCKKISFDFISSRLECIGSEIAKEYSEKKEREDFNDLMRFVEVIPIKKESIDLPPEFNASFELDKNKEKDKPKESNEKNKEEEVVKEEVVIKPKTAQKEQISLLPHVILQYDLIQLSYDSDYQFVHSEDKQSDVIISKNSINSIDLDFYFKECESIIQKEVLVPLGDEPKIVIDEKNDEVSEDAILIDELFNSITISNQNKEVQEEIESKKLNENSEDKSQNDNK